MTVAQENDIFYRSFLDTYYFKKWRAQADDSLTLELIVHRACNLKCTYCYYTRFGEQLVPSKIDKIDLALSNAEVLLRYLRETKAYPSCIAIFAGEAISVSNYSRLFNILFEYYTSPELQEDRRENKNISFPTNTALLLEEGYYDLLVANRVRFKEIGVDIFYSISTDGKFCDPISRPAASGKEIYTDEYYQVVSKFAKEVGAGFHPMISADNIKYWIQNFDWYVDYIKNTFNLPDSKSVFCALYLLEVRNENWTNENLGDLRKFCLYLVHRVAEMYNYDTEEMFFSKTGGLNMLKALGYIVTRGLLCSLQTTLHVRCGDLAIVPCHRTSYEQFIGGKFNLQDNKVTEVVALHPMAHLALVQGNARIYPKCSTCSINKICTFPCPGASFETTKSLFTPAPTMCDMEKVKLLSIIEGLKIEKLYPAWIQKLQDLSNQPIMLSMVAQYRLLSSTIDKLNVKEEHHNGNN